MKAVETCQNGPVILEALLMIAPALAALDAGRARYLLEIAEKLAGQLGHAEGRRLAQAHLAKLPGVVAGAA